jgi:Icc-related predicted phosphoesterase
MKILAVSDQVVERLYSLVPQGHFTGVEMILGCGDLPYSYLEFIVSMLNVPLLYVPGNHDPAYNPQFENAHAEGGTNLDLRVVKISGLLVAGFGGCNRYKPHAVNQYSQSEASLRALRLLPGLLWNRIRHGRALDILITHSPAYGVHDEEEQAHMGLRAINWIIRVARPRFHLHGHTHFFRNNLEPSATFVGVTKSINVFPYKVIEL